MPRPPTAALLLAGLAAAPDAAAQDCPYLPCVPPIVAPTGVRALVPVAGIHLWIPTRKGQRTGFGAFVGFRASPLPWHHVTLGPTAGGQLEVDSSKQGDLAVRVLARVGLEGHPDFSMIAGTLDVGWTWGFRDRVSGVHLGGRVDVLPTDVPFGGMFAAGATIPGGGRRAVPVVLGGMDFGAWGYSQTVSERRTDIYMGRPLRSGAGAVACLTRGEVPARARGTVRRLEEEWASVSTFERTALELAALGAPFELVAGCLRAAAEEVEHARVMAERAARLGAADLWVERPAPTPRRFGSRAAGLRTLAAEAWHDGVVGEGASAVALTRARDRARCARDADDLDRLAREEAGHAWLGEAIHRWATTEVAAA